MNDLTQGFSYNIKGVRYLAANRSLWKFVLIPFCINVAACVLLVMLFVNSYDDVYTFLIKPFGGLDVTDPQGFLSHAKDIGFWILRQLVKILVFITTFVLLIVSVYVLSLIVNGPFYEMLSEKVLILSGRRADRAFNFRLFLAEFWHSLKTEAMKALLFLGVFFTLFLLSFIPVIGILAAITQFFFSTWFFAFGVCAYPQILQRIPLSRMLGWGSSRKLLLIGFGLPAAIPLLGMLLMNFQVVGGTLLYLERN